MIIVTVCILICMYVVVSALVYQLLDEDDMFRPSVIEKLERITISIFWPILFVAVIAIIIARMFDNTNK